MKCIITSQNYLNTDDIDRLLTLHEWAMIRMQLCYNVNCYIKQIPATHIHKHTHTLKLPNIYIYIIVNGIYVFLLILKLQYIHKGD